MQFALSSFSFGQVQIHKQTGSFLPPIVWKGSGYACLNRKHRLLEHVRDKLTTRAWPYYLPRASAFLSQGRCSQRLSNASRMVAPFPLHTCGGHTIMLSTKHNSLPCRFESLLCKLLQIPHVPHHAELAAQIGQQRGGSEGQRSFCNLGNKTCMFFRHRKFATDMSYKRKKDEH